MNGGGSSGSSRRCELCDCAVPGAEQGWQTHVAGIRHRRAVASCCLYGEPGHLVVSAFEAAGAPPPPRYRGKDEVLLGRGTRHRGSAPAAGASSTAQPLPQLQALQRELTKQLATQVGVNSPTYSHALQRFSAEQLAAAWHALAARLQAACFVGGVMQHAAVHRSQQQQHQQQAPAGQQQRLSLQLEAPAEIACLSLQVPRELQQLHLAVPLHTFGALAAATSAATAVFAASLARHHGLQRLELAWHCAQYAQILRQGGTGLSRLPDLWRHVIRALAGAMQVNCGLMELSLSAFPGQLPAAELAHLVTVMGTARAQLRSAVLLGTHARVGQACMLRMLPREVLAEVVARAVPARGCALAMVLPDDGGLPGVSSGSSSSSSSSSEDYSSSDSSSDGDDG